MWESNPPQVKHFDLIVSAVTTSPLQVTTRASVLDPREMVKGLRRGKVSAGHQRADVRRAAWLELHFGWDGDAARQRDAREPGMLRETLDAAW